MVIPDTWIGAFWLGASYLLLRAAWIWSGKLNGDTFFLRRLAGAILLGWAAIIIAGILLGIVHLLSGFTLLLSVAGAATLAVRLARLPARFVGAARATGNGGSARSNRSGGKPTTTTEHGTFKQAAPQMNSSESWWLAGWGAVFAFALARIVWDGLLRFPTDWDSLMYHIPLVVQWLRAHSLYAPNDAFWYNPGNNELVGLWFVAPFSGDFLIALNNLPAAVLFSAVAVESAYAVGIARPLSHLCGLATISTWPFWRQLVDAENDLAVAGLFLAGFMYTIGYAQSGRAAEMVLACLAFGLLAGVKYYALGYAVVGVASLLLLTVMLRGLRAAVRVAVCAFLVASLTSGYWYIRNLTLTGTPTYPKGFSAANDLWGEMRPGSWSSTLLGNGRLEAWRLALDCIADMAGPCQVAAALLSPLCILWLIASGLRSREQTSPVESAIRLCTAFVIVAAGFVLINTPNLVELTPGTMNMLHGHYLPSRFALCFLSMAVLGLTLVVQDCVHAVRGTLGNLQKNHFFRDRGGSRLSIRYWGMIVMYGAYFALGALVMFQLVRTVQDKIREDQPERILLAVNLFTLGGILLVCRSGWPRFRTHQNTVVGVAAIIGFAGICGWLGVRWHQGFAAHYDHHFRASVFSAMAGFDPADTRICVCDYRYYPFLGSRRQFNACRPLWLPTYARLEDYLMHHRANVVAARNGDPSPQRRYSAVKDWLNANPAVFSPIVDGPNYSLVRVNDSLLNAPVEKPRRMGGKR